MTIQCCAQKDQDSPPSQMNISASVDHKTLEPRGRDERCYMAVVAPIRKRWQLEKLENFDDPGGIEALQLQLNPPLTLQ